MAIKRRFECYDGGSSKFWQCWVEGNRLYTEHGRTNGGPIRCDYWELSSGYEAFQDMIRRIEEKLRGKTRDSQYKSYHEVDSIEFETCEERIQGILAQKSSQSKSNKSRLKANNNTHTSEKNIKNILNDWLKKNKWEVQIAWKKSQGPDIEALMGRNKWIIEAKGLSSKQNTIVNNFNSALGEILQKMDDSKTKYSIALPDHGQYKKLWQNLPKSVKDKTRLTALFVDKYGNVLENLN